MSHPWLVQTRTFTGHDGKLVTRHRLVNPSCQPEAALPTREAQPTLPKGPLAVWDNGYGTIQVTDVNDKMVAYFSYNDGSKSNANEQEPEVALGAALAFAKLFNP